MIDDCNINNLAKNQVSAVFNSRAIRKSVSSKFIEICMETPCWCPSRWAPTWRPETNRNMVLQNFCMVSQNFSRISRVSQSGFFSSGYVRLAVSLFIQSCLRVSIFREAKPGLQVLLRSFISFG